jgi:hypothetical protein
MKGDKLVITFNMMNQNMVFRHLLGKRNRFAYFFQEAFADNLHMKGVVPIQDYNINQ